MGKKENLYKEKQINEISKAALQMQIVLFVIFQHVLESATVLGAFCLEVV